MEPAADTHPQTRAPASPDRHPHQPGQPAPDRLNNATAPDYAGTFPGRADQLGQVRREIAAHLAACPATDDIMLIASELAANAIIHTRSRGGTFTIRCHAIPGQARIEVEDSGGPWRPRNPDGRPHGLDIIAALTGPGQWGTHATGTGRRVVWVRLTW